MGSGEDINHAQGSRITRSISPPARDETDESPPDYEELPPYTSTITGSTSATTAIAAAKANEKKKAPIGDITSAFSSLYLTDEPLDLPNAETCLAHLRLLYAFRELRLDVGYCHGLWGIADPGENSKAPEVSLDVMSRLREKRWAVYLARAVDRYEAWWASRGSESVTLRSMGMRGSVAYEMFPLERTGASMVWDENMLVPLGKRIGQAVKHDEPGVLLTLPRCPYGLAHPHAEPARLSRGLHPRRTPCPLA